MAKSRESLEYILAGLMRRYKQRVPDVEKIVQEMKTRGLVAGVEGIENDHIAFRTLGVPNLGIASLEKIFLAQGYIRRDRYRFEQKKLNAYWYAPPEDRFPRIFISELCVDELSTNAQEVIRRYTSAITQDPVEAIDLRDPRAVDAFLHSSLWEAPTWEEYSSLLAESEYAGWTIYNRYYLNHFTISVHSLPAGYSTLEEFNEFLASIGIRLNDAGGLIKVSPDKKLKQSSTVAQMVDGEFRKEGGGTERHKIAGSYVEFAERLVLDEFGDLPPEQITRAHRRDGFEAANADKIFESTFSSQTGRKN